MNDLYWVTVEQLAPSNAVFSQEPRQATDR